MSSRHLETLCSERESFHVTQEHVKGQSDLNARSYSCSQQRFDKQMNQEIKFDGAINERVAYSLASPSGESSICNLEQFLEFTTPAVPFQYLPKTCFWDQSLKRWKPLEAESIPFFMLGDLWDSFGEWSAYGASVPLMLKGAERVVQYYVPYLSALQLHSRSGIRLSFSNRKRGEESDASDSDFRDTSSDGSSDGENDQAFQYKGPLQCRRSTREQDLNFRFSNVQTFSSLLEVRHNGSMSENFGAVHEDHESTEDQDSGRLLFEYFERAAPCSRVPLVDKISDLAQGFPLLKTLRSVELLPSSWLSIAWYPIYRIPTGPTLRDLATCFLTFHSVSTPLQGVSNGAQLYRNHIIYDLKAEKVALPSFGLASYKLRGSFWTSIGKMDRQIESKLQSSAGLWLKQRNVQHPDFDFFLTQNRLSPTLSGNFYLTN